MLAPTFAFTVANAALDDEGNYTLTMNKAALRSADNHIEDKWDTDLAAYDLTGEDKGILLGNVADGSATMQEFISQFTLPELVQIFGGIYGVRTDNYHYFPELAAGAAGGIGQTLEDRGVNFAVMADGPAGLRLTMAEIRPEIHFSRWEPCRLVPGIRNCWSRPEQRSEKKRNLMK